MDIATLDKLVLPTQLEVRYQGGAATRIALPAETWILGGHVELSAAASSLRSILTISCPIGIGR